MSLFLVQHGKSLPKDRDPDQGLSENGTAEVRRIAEVAKNYGIRVSRIVHSTKTRARQTAEIFAAALMPEAGVHETLGLNPLDDVAAFAEHIDETENLMVVGHLPFMERLNCFLTIGQIEKRLFKFQNGGIVCMEKDTETESWHIKWALMPNIG